MAKTIPKTGGNSKIRFIMLEADLADGDLTQITSAITQAMRQGQPVVRQLTTQTAARTQEPADAAAQELSEVEGDAVLEAEGNGSEPATYPKGACTSTDANAESTFGCRSEFGRRPFRKFR